MTEPAKARGNQVSTALIRSSLAYTELLGMKSQSVLDLIELREEDFRDPDGHVSEVYYDRLIHHASLFTQDPFFGLHLGANHSLRHLGILGFLVMNAATLREALQAYQKFQTAFGEAMEMQLEERADACHIRIACFGGALSGRHRVESFFSSLQAAVLSTRSLQMKLQEEGTTFSQLVDDVQREFATGFLRAGRPIAEIAYALGFSEPSAFQRAFKRWTGSSPAQYRDGLG